MTLIRDLKTTVGKSPYRNLFTHQEIQKHESIRPGNPAGAKMGTLLQRTPRGTVREDYSVRMEQPGLFSMTTPAAGVSR